MFSLCEQPLQSLNTLMISITTHPYVNRQWSLKCLSINHGFSAEMTNRNWPFDQKDVNFVTQLISGKRTHSTCLFAKLKDPGTCLLFIEKNSHEFQVCM